MNTYVALFRGINVGGKNILPMNELKALCEARGYADPRTYVQSGNLVFRSSRELASRFDTEIGAAVLKKHGFEPRILVLRGDELTKAMHANPYPQADDDPKSVHLCFLARKSDNPDIASLEGMKKDSESFKLTGNVLYLYAPEGIGRSKLAASFEKALGVAVTARNWRTVRKLVEMVEA